MILNVVALLTNLAVTLRLKIMDLILSKFVYYLGRYTLIYVAMVLRRKTTQTCHNY